MKQNRNARVRALAPEASTDEPASPVNPEPGAPADQVRFASEKEEIAYWAGVAHVLEMLEKPDSPNAAAGVPERGTPRPRRTDPPMLGKRFAQNVGASGDLADEEWAEGQPEIPFTPVALRARHDGWTEARQRGFIRTLRRIGSVSAAARSVGKSARSAYRLRERPNAESFAAAWDVAADLGIDNLRLAAGERALKGVVVPRFYAGRQVGFVHRFDHRLATAALAGIGRNSAEARDEAEYQRGRRAGLHLKMLRAREKAALAEAEWRCSEAEARRRGEPFEPSEPPEPPRPPRPPRMPGVTML